MARAGGPLLRQTSAMTGSLSPTARTTITRHRERGSDDRADLFSVLEEALVCHVGLVRDGQPVVLPTIFAVDPDGPDDGGTLYLHGSVAAPWLAGSPDTPCARPSPSSTPR